MSRYIDVVYYLYNIKMLIYLNLISQPLFWYKIETKTIRHIIIYSTVLIVTKLKQFQVCTIICSTQKSQLNRKYRLK